MRGKSNIQRIYSADLCPLLSNLTQFRRAERKRSLKIVMICGIVDLGSNTIRLSIYQCEPQGSRLLMNRKVMAGLAGYVEHGILSAQGIQVACQVLQEYHALMENFGFHDLHVFATASLRNISNTQQAVDQIQAATGLTVDVLSGEEEAALSFEGAVGAGPESGLLIDLGGASTELVQYQGHQILSSCSLSFGSLSLFSRYVSGLHPTSKERRAIREQVRKQLSRHISSPPTIPHACGVGGTARATCKVVNLFYGNPQDNRLLSTSQLRTLCKRLKEPSQADLRLLLKSVPDRIHTLIPGMLALDTIAHAFQVEDITISPWGVREGYLRSKVWKETTML